MDPLHSMRRTVSFDCVIIGSGLAGCSASIYLSMAKKKHVILAGPTYGGLISTTSVVANYPGINGVSGMELADLVVNHATSFSECELIYTTVKEIEEVQENNFVVYTEDNNVFETKSVILATGSSYKKLSLPDINGVMYCAVCDGFLFSGKTVCVIGGGNSAFESVCYLAPIVEKVYLIHRNNNFRAFSSMVEKAQKYPNVEFVCDVEVKEYIQENNEMCGVHLTNDRIIPCEGVFVSIGHYPNTKFLKDFVDLSDSGHVVVDEHLETSRQNVFAAGDLIDNPWRQGIVAASDGCKAAMSLISQI
jgi:thioredoxin reductase (NADPH)